MRAIILVAAIAYAGLWSSEVVGQDTIGTRLAAGERYAVVADLDSMWMGSINELAKNYPTNQQKAFVAYMQRSTDTNRLHNLL
jgi:hypothetical protein